MNLTGCCTNVERSRYLLKAYLQGGKQEPMLWKMCAHLHPIDHGRDLPDGLAQMRLHSRDTFLVIIISCYYHYYPFADASFLAIYIYKQSFCQDRLGTNIGKTQKKMPFSAPPVCGRFGLAPAYVRATTQPPGKGHSSFQNQLAGWLAGLLACLLSANLSISSCGRA